MTLFYVASLLPGVLICVAALVGGVWGWMALGYLIVAVAVLDELLPENPSPELDAPRAANVLSTILALLHFAVLTLVVHAAGTQPTVDILPMMAATALFFGQVSNSNAHELIHRAQRGLHRLGMWVYISVLFGHHTSAHVLVHHVAVGTKDDPNSARWGEGFYRFALRAWRGSFLLGLRAERARGQRAGRPGWRNPYVVYLLGSLGFLALAHWLGGSAGAVWLVVLGVASQCQLLMSDYVQHYGLRREMTPEGKPEPIAARHSWNSPHRYSSALMLNATRHSDHHGSPARPFPALRLPEAPMLPRALPVMACIALVPPLWRRVMDPRSTAWQARAAD